MKMRGCFERKAIFRYATEIIPEPEKIEIEGHLFGEKINTEFDKGLGIKITQHRYDGCGACLRILAEINESPDAKLSKHII